MKKNLNSRLKRKLSIRKKIFGTTERPRLSVFKSSKNIYVQIIDDEKGVTLVSASGIDKSISSMSHELNKMQIAQEVGRSIAAKAKERGIKKVAFDRNGFLYHGRIKALADTARQEGLDF